MFSLVNRFTFDFKSDVFANDDISVNRGRQSQVVPFLVKCNLGTKLNPVHVGAMGELMVEGVKIVLRPGRALRAQLVARESFYFSAVNIFLNVYNRTRTNE